MAARLIAARHDANEIERIRPTLHATLPPASLRPHAKRAGSNPEKTNADDVFF